MRHGATLGRAGLARAQHILLRQNLVEFGHRKLDAMLAFEKIGDLLAAALLFALTDAPHPALDQSVYLARGACYFTGALRFIHIACEAMPLDTLNPQDDRLAVATQTARNGGVAQTLLM